MTYETKNITFHVKHVKVNSNSRCSRTLPINVAIKSAHCSCERNRESNGFGRRCVESMVEYDQRQSIISMCDTQTLELVEGKVCMVDHSHHLFPQRPVSHHNACELSLLDGYHLRLKKNGEFTNLIMGGGRSYNVLGILNFHL